MGTLTATWHFADLKRAFDKVNLLAGFRLYGIEIKNKVLKFHHQITPSCIILAIFQMTYFTVFVKNNLLDFIIIGKM